MPIVLGQTFFRCELARKVGDFSQLFGGELLSHDDSRERSMRVLRFHTGSGLSFDITVDRAMNLGWDVLSQSPNRQADICSFTALSSLSFSI